MIAGIRQVLTGLRTFWDSGRRVERVAYAVGVVLMLSGLFHLAVYAVDGGSWQGPVSWRKPTTFGLSFGLTLISAAWAGSFVRMGDRARNWLLGLFTAASTIEVFGISLQRWRGEESHFNEETAFDTVLSRAGLAGGATFLVLYVVAFTVQSLRRAPMAGLPPSLRLALRAGWVTLFVAMVVGALMVATAVRKMNTGDDEAAQQQAAYTSAGWLKPAHAITMHAVLILPALAWLASYLGWDESRRLRTVAWASGGYLLLATVVVGETLARTSTLDAPLWAHALAAAGLVAFAAGALAIFAALLRGPTRAGLEHPEAGGQPDRVAAASSQ